MTLMSHTVENDMQMAHLRAVCKGLLFRIVQQSREVKDRGFVVVLTSPTQRAGVSRITSALADALNRAGGECAVSLDCRNLDCDQQDFGAARNADRRNDAENLWQAEIRNANGDNWHGIQAQESLVNSIDRFRQRHRFVLIDCPSLRESQDAIRLSQLADGVILVVEANRTQKDQLLYAERTIESAKGKILGHVLNKRSYVIPAWLSRRMEAISI